MQIEATECCGDYGVPKRELPFKGAVVGESLLSRGGCKAK